MTLEVDLYRSDDYVRDERIPLGPLLRATFEPLLGVSLRGAVFRVAALPVAANGRLDGEPVLTNLRSGYGYIYVRIVLDGVVLYQHPHSVRELVARPLQRMLARRDPAERHWGFGIVGIGIDTGSLVRPTPEIAMSVDVHQSRPQARMFHVEELSEPDPPAASLADLGVTEPVEDEAPVVPVLAAGPLADLTYRLPFSDEVEEGGFLAGHVYADAERPGRRLVLVTAVIKAERTGASLLHFTFTGESFTRAGEAIELRGRSEQLLGWYHSHLFVASDALGLSSIDVDLHRDTFRLPWQIAGLVNITPADRLLRFYTAGDEGMVKLEYRSSTR